jgi:Flp pilus assembly pilin Flp
MRHLPDRRDELGATAAEYALLAALVAAVIIPTVLLLGEWLPTGFRAVSAFLP